MLGIDQWRVKRRKIRTPLVKAPFEGAKRRIDDKNSETDGDQYDIQPPPIAPLRGTEAIEVNGGLRSSGFRHGHRLSRRHISVGPSASQRTEACVVLDLILRG